MLLLILAVQIAYLLISVASASELVKQFSRIEKFCTRTCLYINRYVYLYARYIGTLCELNLTTSFNYIHDTYLVYIIFSVIIHYK